MNILIGPLRFVPFAADIPVSLLAAVHFEQRVERLEVGGEVGDVVLQEQGVLLGKGDLQPGEHVVAPGKGAGDIRGYVFVVGETQVRIHDAVGGGEVALEETRAVIHGRLRLYDRSTPSTFSESRPGVVVLRVRAETKASRKCGGLTM